jgi:hypothetical protein
VRVVGHVVPAAPELRRNHHRAEADPAEQVLQAPAHAQGAVQHLMGEQRLAAQGVAHHHGDHQITPPGQAQRQNRGDAADDHQAHGQKPDRAPRPGPERRRPQVLFHGIANGAGVVGAEGALVASGVAHGVLRKGMATGGCHSAAILTVPLSTAKGRAGQ